MSSQILFPDIRPLEDPPPPENTIINGRRTPCYALAWKCPARDYSTRITEANQGLDVDNIRDKVLVRWIQEFHLPRAQRPLVVIGNDGDFYLIAMFNRRQFGDYSSRSQNKDDQHIAIARDLMFVTAELEPSFKWYRYPMSWTKYSPGSDLK